MSAPVAVIRIVVAVALLGLVAYLAAIGVEASHQLVNQHYRVPECRLPAHVGLEYEPINYDVSGDAALLEEPDPWTCSREGAPAGRELLTEDGVPIAGWYIPGADGLPADGPTVILAHGWTGNKSGQLDEALLFHDGFNAVLFDFRNHGQSGDAATTQGIHEQRDLGAIVDWLVREKGPETIVIWGQSMGGHTAVNVVADDPRVDALILDSTHAEVTGPMARRIEEQRPLGGPGALAAVLGTFVRTGVNVMADDPLHAIDDLGTRPVLVLAGGSDSTIPPTEAERMVARARAAGVDVRLEVCEPAGHAGLLEACPDDYGTWLEDFLAPFAAR